MAEFVDLRLEKNAPRPGADAESGIIQRSRNEVWQKEVCGYYVLMLVTKIILNVER